MLTIPLSYSLQFPKFVVDFMSKQALTDATAWVKKQSELRAPRESALEPTAGGEATATPPKKKFAFFGRRRAKAGQVSPTETSTALEEESSTTEVTTKASKLGLTRYGLVSAVTVLALYNVHLYLSS